MKKKRNTKLYEWQVKARDGGVCKKCNHDVPVLTVDHIIPLAIVEVLDRTGDMAYDDEDNFQEYCKVCNKMKGNRLDITNPKTKPLLQKYIDLIN